MIRPEDRDRGGGEAESFDSALRPARSPGEKGFSIEELERVIRRAAELQFEESGERRVEELVDEEEILRIGGEVGIDPHHLRRAVGEIRWQGLQPAPPSDPGVVARMIGPGFVRVTRAIPGSTPEIERRVEEHLEAGESLTRIRKRGGRSLWEPAGGTLEVFRRAIRLGGRAYDLARAGSVDLSVASLEEGHVLVTMIADLRKVRGETGIGSMAGFGVLGGGITLGLGFVVLTPFLAIPGAVVGAGVGRAIGKGQFRTQSDRVRLAMEGILDRLEAGEPLARRGEGPWSGRLSGRLRGRFSR